MAIPVPGFQALVDPDFAPDGPAYAVWQNGINEVAALTKTVVLEANASATVSNHGTLFDLGGFTLTLDPAADLKEGWRCWVRGPGTLAASSGEEIDGEASIELEEGTGAFLACDGTTTRTVRGGGGGGGPGVPIDWEGTWSSGTNYAANQGVTYSGASYVSRVDGNIGNQPDTSPTQWQLVAAAGQDGADGTNGTDGNDGNDGAPGAPGADGYTPGYRFAFSTNTADSDPGAGTLKANHGTFASITKLWIDNTDAAAASITSWLDGLDDGTTANHKGYLRLQKATDPAVYMEFVVTGTVVDKTGYREVPVSPVAGAVPANATVLAVTFSRTGDKGADGEGAGDVVGPGSATDGHAVLFDGPTGKLVKSAGFAPQPVDSDLTAIAGLSPNNDDVLQRKAGAWTNRTPAQLKADLALAKADVGLGSVDNVQQIPLSYLDTDATLAANSNAKVPSQAAVKAYVDGLALNLGKRQRVRAATTGNITIATALNNGDALDGVTLATGDLVLVKDQSAGAENGVYVVSPSPARATEFDSWAEFPGSQISVAEGSSNADTLWLCTSNDGGTLGTTSIVFAKLVVAGELLASNNLSDLANAGTARANLGVTIGTHVQAYSASLTSFAALGSAADKIGYTTGSNTWAETPLTAAGRALLDDATAGDQRTTLGVGTGDSPQFAAVNVGHATDTTITRAAAGVIAVEGAIVKLAGKETLFIPASAMKPRTTNGAAAGTAEMATNRNMVDSLDFDGTTQEFAQFDLRMPKGWDEGSVTFAALLSQTGAASNFGVVFGLDAVARSNGEALDVAFGTAQTVSATLSSGNTLYITSESAAITIAQTPSEGDLIMFRIHRDTGDGGDTMAADARLHGIVLFYTTNAANDA